jgi:hypothetical protein
MVAGELQFANFNPDGIILFNEKGGNLKIIAGTVNTAPYVLVGGKTYKKIADLKGARIGVSGLRGGATSILLTYLKSKGLQYPRDFSLVVISGGTSARLSALESGAIAAAVLGIPYSDIAVDQGFNRLGDTVEAIPSYEFNAVTINPAWAERNRATVVKYLKAHYPEHALDSRSARPGCGVFHPGDGRKAALRAQGDRLLHAKQNLPNPWRRNVRGIEGEHPGPGARRHLEGAAPAAGEIRRSKLCQAGTKRARPVKF